MVSASAEVHLLPAAAAQSQAVVGASFRALEALPSAPVLISVSGRSGGVTVERESVDNRQEPLSSLKMAATHFPVSLSCICSQ